MKVSKNFAQIILIIVLTIIAILVANFSGIKIPMLDQVKDNTPPSIVYIKKDQLADQTPDGSPIIESVPIPQIVYRANNDVAMKINRDIVNNFKSMSCVDLEDNDSIEEMFFSVTSDDVDNSTTTNKVDKSEMLDRISKSNIYSTWSASSTIIGNKVLSIKVSTSNYCGGVHPNDNVYGLNYNLDKWKDSDNNDIQEKQISLKDIFENYDKDKSNIKQIVLAELSTVYDVTRADCYAAIQGEYDEKSDFDPFSFALNREGVSVLSFGLPHALTACEPAGTLISYESLMPYLKASFKELVK